MLRVWKHIILLVLIFASVEAFAQRDKQDMKLLVSRMYFFTQHLTWQNLDEPTFHIGYFDNDPNLLKELERLKKSKKIQNKEIILFKLGSIDELSSSKIHLLYANKKFSKRLRELKRATEDQNCLIITDEARYKNDVMINFFPWKNTLGFEVHKGNIQNRGIDVGSNLLLIGGKEVDVRQLYIESSKSLRSEKEKVEQQRKQITDQKKELKEQYAQIEKQRNSIDEQKKQIASQNEELLEQQRRMQVQRAGLDTLLRAINLQERKFLLKQKEIQEKEAELKNQQKRVERYNGILEGLRSDIEEHQTQIAEQKTNIKEKEEVISSQSNRIIYILVVLGVAIGLIVLALVAYIGKRRANRQLRDKNNTIEQQNAEIQQRNEEVEAQRDELTKVNTEIHQQKEEIQSQKDELERQKEIVENQNSMITGSIRYAQTIQKAILPPKNILDNSFDHFMLFRPKDIVSGDFYWHSRIERDGGYDSYLAIVDCTGHGVPGAFMSMIGSRLLNLLVNERELTDPAQILHHLDKGVIESLRQDQNKNRDGMEVCFIRVMDRNGKKGVEFSGARRPLYVYQKKSGEIIKFMGSTRGIAGPLKKSKELPFATSRIEVEPEDVLFLTTDGFKDQNDRARKRFGTPALMHLIQSIGHLSMAEQLETVEEVLDNHMQGVEQRDDITLAGVKI